MALGVDIDVDQARINLHPDKSLRQLSSSRLVNRRMHAYHSVIALALLHPTLIILSLFIVLRIRSMKFDASSAIKYFSKSCQKADSAFKDLAETTDLPQIEERMLCVVQVIVSFLLVVIRQRLLLSGDVEQNPGPLDGTVYMCECNHVHPSSRLGLVPKTESTAFNNPQTDPVYVESIAPIRRVKY